MSRGIGLSDRLDQGGTPLFPSLLSAAIGFITEDEGFLHNVITYRLCPWCFKWNSRKMEHTDTLKKSKGKGYEKLMTLTDIVQVVVVRQ